MASKMVTKVENYVYSKYESQSLPIAEKKKNNCFQVFHAMTKISDEMYAV